jgi:hypothetical protein
MKMMTSALGLKKVRPRNENALGFAVDIAIPQIV